MHKGRYHGMSRDKGGWLKKSRDFTDVDILKVGKWTTGRRCLIETKTLEKKFHESLSQSLKDSGDDQYLGKF